MRGKTRNQLLTVITAVTLVLTACGGESSEAGSDVTSSPDEQSADTAPATTSGSALGVTEDGDAGEPTTGSGSATITIAGVTVTFDSIACFEGEEAVAAFGDEDLTFGAIAETETESGTSMVAVSSSDNTLGITHTILYLPQGDTSLAWQRVGPEAASIADGSITAEGEFSEIVDGTHTDETANGTFEADCG